MDEKKTYQVVQPLLLAAVLVVGMFIGTQIDDELPGGDLVQFGKQDDWDEVIDVVQFVKSRYGEELSEDSISAEMIQTLVSGLDPHSYYLSGMQYDAFKERMASSYTGIGIEYQVIEDTVTLVRVMDESPAASAGLLIGDQILAVNGTSLFNLEGEEAYEVWRRNGKQLKLTILRSGEGEKVIDLEKDHISVPSVPVAMGVGDEVGYIKIDRFSSDTYRSFMEYLEKLYNDEGVRSLIIDVRNNPGGSLDQVVKILNQLIKDKDRLMLYMEGKHVQKTEYKSTGKVFFPLEGVAVIINENSVSASEVLAGVLQDLGLATIVGRRSFGKALVQEMYPVSDRSAINLTIGKYYLPSGRYIQKSFKDRDAYDKEIDRRFASGELFHPDSLHLDTASMVVTQDGVPRPIGEGVLPDVFVPGDSSHYLPEWKSLDKIMSLKAFEYLQTYPAMRQKIQNGEFDIELSDSIMQNAFGDQLNEDINSTDLGDMFKRTLVWYAGGQQRYYEYIKDVDPEIMTAIKVLTERSLRSQKN